MALVPRFYAFIGPMLLKPMVRVKLVLVLMVPVVLLLGCMREPTPMLLVLSNPR
jgi:hypothetical protein